MWLDLPDGSAGGGDEPMVERNRIRRTDNRLHSVVESRHHETIAGYVLYRRVNTSVIEYLLVKKVELNDWTPPKGHVELDEDCFDGAEREVFEETGFAIGDYEALEQYPIYFEYKTNQQVLKQVHLWAAKFLNFVKPVRLSQEHDEFQWMDYEATLAVVKQPYKEAIMAADLVIRTYESL